MPIHKIMILIIENIILWIGIFILCEIMDRVYEIDTLINR